MRFWFHYSGLLYFAIVERMMIYLWVPLSETLTLSFNPNKLQFDASTLFGTISTILWRSFPVGIRLYRARSGEFTSIVNTIRPLSVDAVRSEMRSTPRW